MFRQIIHPTNSNELIIKLPEEYISKEVEIIAFEIDPVKVDKNRETRIKQSLDFFKSLPRIDMSNYKFNREEANER